MEKKCEITNELGLVRQKDALLYQELLGNFSKKTCVLFVGSGPSSSIFKPWSDLIDALGKKAALQQRPKESKFRFADRCRNKIGEDEYYRFLKEKFDDTGLTNRYVEIHSHMVNTAFGAFVTTNYDLCLERAASMDVRISGSPLLEDKITSPDQPINEIAGHLIESIVCWPGCISATFLRDPGRTLYHIHGFIGNYTNKQTEVRLVLTEKDYEEAYEISDDLTGFLKELLALSSSTVVFCGYGFKDHRLFKRVIERSKQSIIQLRDRKASSNMQLLYQKHFIFEPIKAEYDDQTRRIYYAKSEIRRSLNRLSRALSVFKPEIEFVPILYANPWPEDEKRKNSYLTRIFEDIKRKQPFVPLGAIGSVKGR